MFNIIETLQNYFMQELLADYISAIKWHFTLCKLVAAMFGGKLFGGSVIDGQCCPCGFDEITIKTVLVSSLSSTMKYTNPEVKPSHRGNLCFESPHLD